MQRTTQAAIATMLLVATQKVWAEVNMIPRETSSSIPTTPECATPCLLEVFQGGGCEIDRLADCVCTNNTLQAHVSACVQMSCEFNDQVGEHCRATEIAGFQSNV
ncbi:uncharacterized protein CTRU02_211890 [Colletotrichum truncatum]|uniref:Integral membrane protein n=1 Tax=Colletotrichum truncatum TaxID=5467 RepID=A0ACC3YP32_COLTU|nr:uncharacterized protein CTRU02_07299 [Colletotrichum truncatum]KAF6791537.1 integral membrane protein [Colletotrichum truncatum]